MPVSWTRVLVVDDDAEVRQTLSVDFVRKPVDTAYLLRSIDVAVGMKQLESR